MLVRPPRLRGRRKTLVICGGVAAAVVIVAVIAVVLNNVVSDRTERENAASVKEVAAEHADTRAIAGRDAGDGDGRPPGSG